MSANRNLVERLRPPKYEPIQPPYVANVRVQVDRCKNTGSQQHRLRYSDECWLISQHRWIVEQRAGGASWDSILAVLECCVTEAAARRDVEEREQDVTADAFIEDVRTERAAGFYEDVATIEALHHRSIGHFRSVAERARAQAAALNTKARRATALAVRMGGGR